MIGNISLSDHARPFLVYLDDWYQALPAIPWDAVIGDRPERVALLSVDMINGFCKEGPLAGPRVGALAEPVAELFRQAYAHGVRAFALTQDTHPADTPEFQSYPPHCMAGTPESQTIVELASLPFFSEVAVFEKNSLSSHINTAFGAWVAAHAMVDTFVVVGDCTDLCVYSAAMHLRLEANAQGLRRRVIVPASAVDTFDTPVSVARELGIKAHDGDLHHVIFLHHMAMNGVEVVSRLG